MRIATIDTGGKSVYLQSRLQEEGHELIGSLDGADVLLIDCDWAYAPGRGELISQAHRAGVVVAVYPHGGLPTSFVYDGLTPPNPLVEVRLEHGPGMVEILARPDLKQEACGWLFSPTEPFQPVKDPRKILFVPQHPNMEMLVKGTTNGSDPGPAMNQPVFQQLLKLGYDLTVSYVGPQFRSGIYPHPKAKLVGNENMLFPQTLELAAQADVVIAAGTMAAAAVALGKPTVMLGETDLTDYVGGHYVEADHADQYRDVIRYPLNVTDGDLDTLIGVACEGSPELAEWRRLFVGDDGTAAATRVLERLVGGDVLSPTDVTIAGVTAQSSAKG